RVLRCVSTHGAWLQTKSAAIASPAYFERGVFPGAIRKVFRCPRSLLRGALNQFPHKAVYVAHENIAGAVAALDRLAAGRDHGTAGLRPLIHGGVYVAYDHGECG